MQNFPTAYIDHIPIFIHSRVIFACFLITYLTSFEIIPIFTLTYWKKTLCQYHAGRDIHTWPMRNSSISDNMSPQVIKTTEIDHLFFPPCTVHDHPYSWDQILTDGGWLKTQRVGGPFVCKLSGDERAWRDRRYAWAKRSCEVHGSRSSEAASRNALAD